MDYTDLHHLVDQVPRQRLRLVARLMEAVIAEGDPVARALGHAPEDDERVTAEDVEAQKAGREDARQGRLVLHQDLTARLTAEKRL